MAQVFFPSANTISRVSLIMLPVVVMVLGGAVRQYYNSQFVTGVGFAVDQPIQFSHEHHVAGLGIDCRFCHLSVEESPFAGIPSTQTCMTCHSQIWADAEMLRPVRESWRTGEPLQWNRVHDVPDFVYFDHSVHIAKGVSCVACHGRVDEMPLIWKTQTLHMQWCLDCHRDPHDRVVPLEAVFEPRLAGAVEETFGPDELFHAKQRVQPAGLMNCTACHR